MDFLHTSYSSAEILERDVSVEVSGEVLSVQNTISQDRTAGANVWEDGTLQALIASIDHKDLSQQRLLPGDFELLPALEEDNSIVEEAIESLQQFESVNHKEAARVVRAQLVRNRPYLADPTEAYPDWSSYLAAVKETDPLPEVENQWGEQNLGFVTQYHSEEEEIALRPSSSFHDSSHSASTLSMSSQSIQKERDPVSLVADGILERVKDGDHFRRENRSDSPSQDLELEKPDALETLVGQRAQVDKSGEDPSESSKIGPRIDEIPERPQPVSRITRSSLGPKKIHFTTHVRSEVKYSEPQSTPTVYCIVCEIKCSAPQPYSHHRALLFEDVPFLRARSETSAPHLEGTHPIESLGKYLNERRVSFVILRTYFCSAENLTLPVVSAEIPPPEDWTREGDYVRRVVPLKPPELRYPETFVDVKVRQDIVERMQIFSEPLIRKIQQIAKYNPGNLIGEIDGQPSGPLELHFPYIFVFHHQLRLTEKLDEESGDLKPLLLDLVKYSESCQGDKYGRATEQFSIGKVSPDLQDFLFEANEAVVYKEKDVISVYMIRRIDFEDWAEIQLDCWSWGSNGTRLKRKRKTIAMRWPKEDEFSIDSMEVYPLKFASQKTQNVLLQQGKKYWNLRSQHKVAYSGWDVPGDQIHYESRFMIDQRTYNKLHPNSATFLFSKDPILPYDEYPLEIELDADLPDLDYMLCPHIVQGFFLKEKHWVSLYVRKVEPVNWNKEAFDRLVLPPKTKELIKALLLTNEGRVSDPVGVCGGKRQDLIAGKGTGLIVLLHGGPGTGKTLTAESVAELAEKPLYSVTCGDIGTEPDAVESYLRRVLYFGKTWNCVLLLDEADVFLEERGLQDLKRNSLVSIFLRILEYYSGILILTSNRVGTFDEAFRSRIQLALRYPDPDPPFRKKIWRNFFDMLEADEEDADLDELKEHIEELSDLDMNGREIRNALTTARQLALYKKKTLGWVHLSQAVNAARDFNKYLMDVQGHSNKDWAREISLR